MCFSWYSNTQKMFTVKTSPEPLDILNGVRFFATCNVVLGHVIVFQLGFPWKNGNAFFDIMESPSVALIYNGLYSVDLFFWLSGFLMGYLILTELVRKDGQIGWGLLYFHRYWRIVPTVAFMMFFTITLGQYLGNGPLWYRFDMSGQCDQYWWTNLTFLINFVPDGLGNQCVGVTWFLANDFQFFLITPPIMFLYYKYGRKVGWALLSILGLISIICSFAINAFYGYSVCMAGGGNMTFFQNEYTKPYVRVGPYAIGVAMGWIFFTYYHYKKTKEVFDIWALTIARAITGNVYIRYGVFFGGLGLYNFILFIQHSAYADVRNGFTNWNSGETVMFLGTHRFLIGIALSAILMPVLLGRMPFLREFLGAAVFAPLAKMCFCVYLMHITVLFCILTSTETSVHFSALQSACLTILTILISFFVGYATSMLVEAPCMNLEKIMFGGGRQSSKPETVQKQSNEKEFR